MKHRRLLLLIVIPIVILIAGLYWYVTRVSNNPKVRLRYNHWLPRLTGYNITLFPFVLFAEDKEDVPYTTLKHEAVHFQQVITFGWFTFYISYVLYYLVGLFVYKSHESSYYSIPYEVSAYKSQNKSPESWQRHWGFFG